MMCLTIPTPTPRLTTVRNGNRKRLIENSKYADPDPIGRSQSNLQIVATARGRPNASRLLWAGFMAILAAGVGFAIRGGILDNWGKEFNFTATQLGALGGAGPSGLSG